MRYIIVEKDKGIFLGMFASLPLFSNELNLPIIKAISTASEEDAHGIISYVKEENDMFEVLPIDTTSKYIPIDILIKSGYSAYTGKMLLYHPTYTETIQ